MKFGDKLYELRTSKDLTQDELVQILNNKYPNVSFNKSMISKWENNIHTPTDLYQVICLAKFLGVNPDWMMGISDDKYGEKYFEKSIDFMHAIVYNIIRK